MNNNEAIQTNNDQMILRHFEQKCIRCVMAEGGNVLSTTNLKALSCDSLYNLMKCFPEICKKNDVVFSVCIVLYYYPYYTEDQQPEQGRNDVYASMGKNKLQWKGTNEIVEAIDRYAELGYFDFEKIMKIAKLLESEEPMWHGVTLWDVSTRSLFLYVTMYIWTRDGYYGECEMVENGAIDSTTNSVVSTMMDDVVVSTDDIVCFRYKTPDPGGAPCIHTECKITKYYDISVGIFCDLTGAKFISREVYLASILFAYKMHL